VALTTTWNARDPEIIAICEPVPLLFLIFMKLAIFFFANTPATGRKFREFFTILWMFCDAWRAIFQHYQ